MRNIIRTALIVGTLATPMIAMADTPKKDAPAAKDTKAGDMKDAPKADAKAPKTDAKDTKAPAKAKKDTKKDVKEPAAK
ncbi:MAG TPA: hypothetical protein VFT22_12975 [Kofleriaceae bacterium]|nr:hypothetical protein [Kofleriaceae bacterium]